MKWKPFFSLSAPYLSLKYCLAINKQGHLKSNVGHESSKRSEWQLELSTNLPSNSILSQYAQWESPCSLLKGQKCPWPSTIDTKRSNIYQRWVVSKPPSNPVQDYSFTIYRSCKIRARRHNPSLAIVEEPHPRISINPWPNFHAWPKWSLSTCSRSSCAAR